jgi:hypothetical protein
MPENVNIRTNASIIASSLIDDKVPVTQPLQVSPLDPSSIRTVRNLGTF